MQLFSTILATATSVFLMVSADDSAILKSRSRPSVTSRPSRVSRHSRSPKHSEPSIIGGDSSVWGPSLGCDSSSYSYPSPCSSSWSSSSISCDYPRPKPCPKPCPMPCTTTICNPFSPAVAPLCPLTECEPLLGANYGPYPGPGCAAPCGPYDNGCAPCGPYRNGCAPLVDDCRPCGPRPLGQRLGNVQPWYVYLTATFTSTFETTTSSFASTTFTQTTVSYTVFTINSAPTTYYNEVV
jgi:hypothetical protein